MPIQKSLGIGLPDTGIVVAVTLAASVFGGVLFGWLGDRIGPNARRCGGTYNQSERWLNRDEMSTARSPPFTVTTPI